MFDSPLFEGSPLVGSPFVGRLFVGSVFVDNLFVGSLFDDGIQLALKQDDDRCDDDLFVCIHGYSDLDPHEPDMIRLHERNHDIYLEVDTTRVVAEV